MNGEEKVIEVKYQNESDVFKFNEETFDGEFDRLRKFIHPWLSAKSYRESHVIAGYDYDDCYQEGLVVLLRAVRGSKPYEGKGKARSFMSYLHWYWGSYFESHIKLKQNLCRAKKRAELKGDLAKAQTIQNFTSPSSLEGYELPATQSGFAQEHFVAEKEWQVFYSGLSLGERALLAGVVRGYAKDTIKSKMSHARYNKALRMLKRHNYVKDLVAAVV